MLTLLTTTGCRPQAWAICQQLMLRQDFPGCVRWIIVDDGEAAQPITFARRGWSLQVVRPLPRWSAGQNTQSRNLLAGLELVDAGDRLLIIEDDDYYATGYLSAANTWLNSCDLAGEPMARYYHLGRGLYRECMNSKHASLCSTALAGDAIDHLRRIAGTHAKFIDMELWRTYPGKKQLYLTRMCVGIKGLPGRNGIGAGHRMAPGGGSRQDRGGAVLARWLGDGLHLYRDLMVAHG